MSAKQYRERSSRHCSTAREQANSVEKNPPLLLPVPRITERHVNLDMYNHLVDHGFPLIAARLAAGRLDGPPTTATKLIHPTIDDLDNPYLMADIERAADRLANAIVRKEATALVSDYDSDGLGAVSTAVSILTKCFGVPSSRIQCYIGQRLTDGYGVTDAMVDRILASPVKPGLVITMDAGSKDGPRIKRLIEAGIDCVVTDHHTIDDYPTAAYAFVNPQRADCQYPDKSIAGGFVIWLLLWVTADVLRKRSYADVPFERLVEYWDFVSCSTVADCVSLKSVNNRIVVRSGLDTINQFTRPCWSAIRPYISNSVINEMDIGFAIGPRINAMSRVSEPEAAFHFLTAEDEPSAQYWASVIDSNNNERKVIEKKMKACALRVAAEQVEQKRRGLVVFLENGHPGVQGICASRVGDAFGRPTIVFSPSLNRKGLLTGSGRSIDGFDIHEALLQVQQHYPKLIQRWGGHPMALGVSIEKAHLATFSTAFEESVCRQLSEDDVGPVIVTDGELLPFEINPKTVAEINYLAPYGRQFEVPIFHNRFRILDIRVVGQDKNHLQLLLQYHGQSVKAIWFFAIENENTCPVRIGDVVHFAYQLDINEFRGQKQLQLKLINRVADDKT